MTHPFVGGGLRVLVVALALVVGCSSGHCPGTPGPVAVSALDPEAPRVAATTAETPRAGVRPAVKVLAVLPADAAIAEEQEATPPAVVRGARPDGEDPPIPYNHAPDYHWLTGELRYSPARAAWCVHYATQEEEDRHGGSVTLIAPGKLTGLHSGQAVCVEGELVNPQADEPSPSYRLRNVRPLSSE